MCSVNFTESISPIIFRMLTLLVCRTNCYQKYLSVQIEVIVTVSITCLLRLLCYNLCPTLSFTSSKKKKKKQACQTILYICSHSKIIDFWHESINQIIIRRCNICLLHLRNLCVSPTFGCLYEVCGWQIWGWGHLGGQIFEVTLWDWCLNHHSHHPPWLSHNCCCASADMGSPHLSRFPGNHSTHPEAPGYKEDKDFSKSWISKIRVMTSVTNRDAGEYDIS